jgi:septum formation protein
MMLPLILASSSPYRRQLLAQLGLDFECRSPDTDESALPEESPQQLAARLAYQKALAVAEQHPNALIIGSDQVACLDDKILSKPGSIDKAIEQLTLCSGRAVNFYTGLCLYNSRRNSNQQKLECFTAHFRQLSPEQICRYIKAEQPLDCAGSFKVEGLGISLFERLEGNDPNSLIGLPLIQLVTMLNKEGLALP